MRLSMGDELQSLAMIACRAGLALLFYNQARGAASIWPRIKPSKGKARNQANLIEELP